MISKSIYQPCRKCNKIFDAYSKWGTKSFCSKTCANSRGPRSTEFKNRMKELYTGVKKPESWHKKYHQTIEKRNPKPVCIICGNKCQKLNYKTCSRECFKHLCSIRRKISKPVCIICGNKCQRLTYKTCSRECFKHLCSIRPKKGRSHKGTYKGYNCDSTYELAFLIWHLDKNIEITRSTNVYDYIFDNKFRKYNPDFIVHNIEYEIKGYICDQSQAKLSQHPHIKLIDKNSIKPYMKYVKEKYNVKNLKDLYE